MNKKFKKMFQQHHRHDQHEVQSFGLFFIFLFCFSKWIFFRETNTTSSPGRVFPKEFHEPRIPLTRVDLDDKFKSNHSTSLNQEIITHSYSPQRSTSRTNPVTNYGLRNPYDFTNDEPVMIRHEHKATPFRPSNFSSSETTSMRIDSNEIRSRLTTNTNEPKEIKIQKDLPTTKNDQIVVPKKSLLKRFLFSKVFIDFFRWFRWRNNSVYRYRCDCGSVSLCSLPLVGKLDEIWKRNAFIFVIQEKLSNLLFFTWRFDRFSVHYDSIDVLDPFFSCVW